MAKRGRRGGTGAGGTGAGGTRAVAAPPRSRAGAAAPAAPSSLWAWLPALLGALVYWGSLHHPFVYDDVNTVVDNPSLRDLSNWKFLLVYSPFRPVVNLSYALDTALWGVTPFGFHLSSLLLHSLDAALFFGVVRALMT